MQRNDSGKMKRGWWMQGEQEEADEEEDNDELEQQSGRYVGNETVGDNVCDLRAMHAEKMKEFERREKVLVPQMRERVEAFRAVLRDEEKLTDAMANAVFKDKGLLQNARLKRRARNKKLKFGESDERTKEMSEHLISEEAYERVHAESKEHTNYLRRLKGKTGSKLTTDEQDAIRVYIAEKEAWIERVLSQQDYMDYLFKALPLIEEYEREKEKHSEYIRDENTELERQDDEIERRLPTSLRPPETATLPCSGVDSTQLVPFAGDGDGENSAVVERTRRTGMSSTGNISDILANSDAFSRMVELQSEYCRLVGIPDPTGFVASHNESARERIGYCSACECEKIVDQKEAIYSCPKCGLTSPFIDCSMRVVPFSENVNLQKTSRNSYERTSYYIKWKRIVTGDLNSEICAEDWETIFAECVKRRWDRVDKAKIRRLLRQLNMSHYYSLVPAITNELNGVPLIKFAKDEEATLDAMFDEAVRLFEACPMEIKQRRNFISYRYYFYQACTLAGFTQYLDAFPLLIGIDNKKRHDRIWEWMCNNKQRICGGDPWKFHPTV